MKVVENLSECRWRDDGNASHSEDLLQQTLNALSFLSSLSIFGHHSLQGIVLLPRSTRSLMRLQPGPHSSSRPKRVHWQSDTYRDFDENNDIMSTSLISATSTHPSLRTLRRTTAGKLVIIEQVLLEEVEFVDDG